MFEIDGYDPKNPPRRIDPNALASIELQIRQGGHVSDHDLAAALRKMPEDAKLPPAVRDLIAGRLDGSIKRPTKGRPSGARSRRVPRSIKEAATFAYMDLFGVHPRLGSFIGLVVRLKRRAKRQGKPSELDDETFGKVAKRFGFDPLRQGEYLRRELRRAKRTRKI